MGSANAIIARMGIDLGNLKRDLSAAETLAVRAAGETARKMNAAGRGGHGAGGGGHSGGAGNARMFGDPINAVTGSTGNVAKIGMLSHLIGGAGPAAAVLVLTQAISQLSNSMLELHEHTQEIDAALGKGTQKWYDKFLPTSLQEGVKAGDRPVESVDAMRERSAHLKELSERQEPGGYLKNFFSGLDTVTGGGAVNGEIEKNEQAKRAAFDERARLSEKIAQWTKAEAAARDEAVHGSERQGELDLAAIEHEKKIAELKDQFNSGKIMGPELAAGIKTADAEHARTEEAIKLKSDAAFRERELVRTTAEFREKGDDEGVNSAKERVWLAQHELEAAQALSNEARDTARIKLEAAQAELGMAERHRDAVRNQQATAIAVANLQASAEAKRVDELARERENLTKQFNATPNADERKALEEKLAKNAEAGRGAENAMAMRGFDAAGSMIDSGQGAGQAEAQRVAQAHLELEQAKLGFMGQRPEFFDAAALEDQRAKIAQMKRAIEEVQHQIEMTNAAAKAQTGEMELQLQHQDTIAAAVREQFEYQQKIAEAQRNGNKELADQLSAQKDIALAKSAQRAQEARQERDGLSLGELAKRGGSLGHEARQVERLERRANRQMGIRGHQDQAKGLHDRANQLRNHLEATGALKPSEARRDMGAEMDKSELLKAIKENTSKPIANKP